MGNISSCYCGGNYSKNNVEMAKIIDSQGTLRVLEVQLTAAEVMLEYPGYVVSPVDEIRRTRRVIAMKAEETLVGRRVYLLVPIGKVNYKITELQMSLADSACGKKRASRGGSKVSPVVVSDDGGAGGERVVDRSCGGKGSGEGGGHWPRHIRPWTPVLEPILEGY